jgi:NDP-sugar pyrophosphorylase family protein
MTLPQPIRQAVILAAGLGTRLRPLTDRLPKAMVPVGGRPLLEHHVLRLRAYGIEEIFVNLHYLPEVIREHCGDGSRWGIRIEYRLEPEIRGTAGGVKGFESKLDESFFVIYGDIFSLLDYRRMARSFFERKGAAGMELVGPTSHPEDSDLAEVDEEMRFVRIHRKPHASLPARYQAMRGIFILSREVLAEIPEGIYYEIDHHLLPRLLEMGKPFYGHPSEDYTRDMGTWERYREVEAVYASLRPEERGLDG